MSVKVDVESLDSIHRQLVVEVPADEVSAEIERTFKQFSRGVRIPGFRPGRAPRHVLEQMYGDRVRQEVFDRLTQQSFAKAIEQEDVAALGPPQVVTEQAAVGEVLRYRATVEVKPELRVEHFEGIEVGRELTEISEADVDTALERLQESYAQLVPVTDRTVIERGDWITVDYTARIDQSVVGKAEDRNMEIGSEAFPEEFAKRIEGCEVPSDVAFDVEYPEDWPTKAIAAKTVSFEISLKSLSEKEVPGLDDDFAKDHGESETLEELRAEVRKQLEAEAVRVADESMRTELLSSLSEANEMPVPHAMIERRVASMVEELKAEWERSRLTPRDQMAAIEDARQGFRERATQQLKVELLLEAIAAQESLEISDSEVDERVDAIASSSEGRGEALRTLYSNPQARNYLQTQMLRSRALGLVLDRSVVNETTKSRVAD